MVYTGNLIEVFFQGEPASWRDFHTATSVGKYMYIFGGRGKELEQTLKNVELSLEMN
jgi:hypothetical protein